MPKTTFTYTNGFSLVELIVSIAILSVLVSMGAPSFKEFIKQNEVYVGSEELHRALFYTRSQALKWKQTVYLCLLNDDERTCDESSSSINFNQGWLIFVDCNNDGSFNGVLASCDLDGDSVADQSELLHIRQAFTSSIDILPTQKTLRRMSYNMIGRARSGSFCIENSSSKKTKIIIASTGRIRTEQVESCR
ncbi:MAG: Unknown protein [uncultured Thiotrichaceae bacterium]|uniref:Type II secretion system protein H n=1 Tax=uncultured Thiotrichaceae bacterium TaxID=298394 RepID=A0A6S6T5X4_9GAMM|nr:MAG: Unknown protein [uncultured Thiotrichaceae bacterium]